jgi:hypothetical protein
MAYKMTLADGTVIENLDYNGTHCTSKTRLDPTIFTDERLATVTITQGKDKIELSNMELIDLSKPEGSDEYYICMVQKSPTQIKQAEIERAEQETNLAVAELAIDVSTTVADITTSIEDISLAQAEDSTTVNEELATLQLAVAELADLVLTTV